MLRLRNKLNLSTRVNFYPGIFDYFGIYILAVLITLVITLSSCSSENNIISDNILQIHLNNKIGNPNIFETSATEIHFIAALDRHPKFHGHQLKFYKEYPLLDTSMISMHHADKWKFYYELYKNNFLEDSALIKALTLEDVDSLGYNLKLDNELAVFTGIKEGKQLVIVDQNKNYDFGDDKTYMFDRNFSVDSLESYEDYINLPVINHTYEKFEKGEITKYNRKLAIYPNRTHQYTSFFPDNSLNKKLHVIGKILDYWQGEVTIDNTTFDFYCQGHQKDYLQILIKPDSLAFATYDYTKNKNFEYRLKDTVSLGVQSFIIDSFAYGNSKLLLRKIDVAPKIGLRTGETLQDLALESPVGEKVQISEIAGNHKYTLIDVWASWCPPCKEATPILKELYQTHYGELEIIGIAYDSQTDKVVEYIEENDLNWPQTLIKPGSDKASLIESIRIEYYPTFILLDENQKIIKRTVGVEGLQQIVRYLTSHDLKN